jgi:hypothetical protein
MHLDASMLHAFFPACSSCFLLAGGLQERHAQTSLYTIAHKKFAGKLAAMLAGKPTCCAESRAVLALE